MERVVQIRIHSKTIYLKSMIWSEGQREQTMIVFFFPISRALLPNFHTNCPDGRLNNGIFSKHVTQPRCPSSCSVPKHGTATATGGCVHWSIVRQHCCCSAPELMKMIYVSRAHRTTDSAEIDSASLLYHDYVSVHIQQRRGGLKKGRQYREKRGRYREKRRSNGENGRDYGEKT